MAEEQQWYYLSNGEQVGPISPADLQAMAASGAILPETQLWTEGLEEWLPATQVEGLFAIPSAPHPHLVTGAEARASHPFAGEGPADGDAQTAGLPPAEPAMPLDGISPAGADYPSPGPMKATFAWFVALPLLAILSMGGGIGILVTRMSAKAAGSAPTTDEMVAMVFEAMGVFLGATLAFALCFLFFTFLKMIVLYRAWGALQFGPARTTPGKAVGFLFIPFFQFYWRFVAYLGLAKDWNHIHATHPNLVGAPRINEGLVATYCIFSILRSIAWWSVMVTSGGSEGNSSSPLVPAMIIIWGVSLLLEIIFLNGVCRLVNFMGKLHYQQTQPQQHGLKFY